MVTADLIGKLGLAPEQARASNQEITVFKTIGHGARPVHGGYVARTQLIGP
jgi:hypothetical protein